MLKHTMLSLSLIFATPLALANQPKSAPATKPATTAQPTANTAQTTKSTPNPMTTSSTNPKVTLHTSMGAITLELYADKAPKTVDNFEQYVKDGFYNGTVFHRVIDNFMIQGGGWTKELQRKRTRAPIHNKANNGLSNLKYTIAMARTSDPHSASAEFFINVVDNKRLDYTSDANGLTWGYCVFGKVVAGQDVVDKIKAVPTADKDHYPQTYQQRPL